MNNNLKNNKPKWIPKSVFMKIDNNVKDEIKVKFKDIDI